MGLTKYIRKSWLVVIVLFLFSTGVAYAADRPAGLILPDVTVKEVLINFINWIAGIATTIAILVIIIAGILWTTASGNENQILTARKMLIAGIVGLIITLGAWALVRVVSDIMLPVPTVPPPPTWSA